eukprot:TRINITY_DN3616_c0_g1_i3.p1 TRINITY_DN3616_c0_g1~~TRINITY_DN3616_c0_g1_i3.p1  ORF type:complete len:786 (+),score=224.17 TRINITY_DN3616_c0_g1_i3:3-2360(+)
MGDITRLTQERPMATTRTTTAAAQAAAASAAQAQTKVEIIGKLQLQVLRGRNLSARDFGNTSDPYCSVKLDTEQAQAFKTGVQSKTLNPEWNQTFTFNFVTPLSVLDITVLDDHKMHAPVFLGHTTLDVVRDGLTDQEPHELWLPLSRVTMTDLEVTGDLLVRAQYKYKAVCDNAYKSFEAMGNNSWSVAIRLLTAALQRFPNDIKLYTTRCNCYLMQNDMVKAIDDANHAVVLNPDSPEGHYWRGIVLFENMRHSEARLAFEQGLVVVPGDLRLTSAIEQLDLRIVKQKVKQALSQGKEAFAMKKYEEATAAFTEAITNNPQNAVYYIYRAITHMATKKFDFAIEDAMKCATLNPDWLQRDCMKAGLMGKEGKVNVMMKRRYFVAKQHCLFYLPSDKDLTPKGVIPLTSFYCGCKQKNKKKFVIVTPNRTFTFTTDSEEETSAWVKTLDTMITSPLDVTSDPLENMFWKAGTKKSGSVRVGDLASAATFLGDKLRARMIAVYTQGSDHTGYLYKMGQVRTTWQRRFFLLKGNTLFYADLTTLSPQQQEHPERLETVPPKGSIELANCIFTTATNVHKDFAFKLRTPARAYCLAADNQQQYETWRTVLLKLMPCGDAATGTIQAHEFLNEEKPTIKADPVTPKRDVKQAKYVPGSIKSSRLPGGGAAAAAAAVAPLDPTPALVAPVPLYAVTVAAPGAAPGVGLENTTAEARYFAKFDLDTPTLVSVEATAPPASFSRLATMLDEEKKPLLKGASVRGGSVRASSVNSDDGDAPAPEDGGCCTLL